MFKADSNNWGKISADQEEAKFLEGPQGERFEFFHLAKMMIEFIRGYYKLRSIGPCVTIFGSARIKEDNQYYISARQMAQKFGHLGFSIMTGGGPGIMEAANRGARDVAARSIGCNIKLPQEQKPNPYLDLWVGFEHFFIRKLMLLKYSYAFIGCPGGYGTLDEIFEVSVLIQTGKIKNFPIVLIGKDYWNPLIEFLRESLLKKNMIDARDFDSIYLTDSIDDAVEHVSSRVFGPDFGLRYVSKLGT